MRLRKHRDDLRKIWHFFFESDIDKALLKGYIFNITEVRHYRYVFVAFTAFGDLSFGILFGVTLPKMGSVEKRN